MEIGPLRQRVEIQARPAPGTNNEFNERAAADDFATVATRWAKVEPLTGRELWYAGQVRPDLTHKVTLRYYVGLTTAMRFRLRGTRKLNIDSVASIDEENRTMVCMCKEEV